MARQTTINVRCKNKLCTYEGTTTVINDGSASLVCPECGFKTLEQHWPELQRIFNQFELSQVTKNGA